MALSTRTVFRICIVIYVLLVVSSIASGFYLTNPVVSDINDYIYFTHLASLPPPSSSATILYLNTGLVVVALIGMWLFWKPARWLFLLAIVIAYALGLAQGDPRFLNLQVQSSLMAAENTFVGLLLALAFFNRDVFRQAAEQNMPAQAPADSITTGDD